MYGWGNMRNGELGLGGLEEDVIPAPRALSFPSSPKIQSGKISLDFLSNYTW